MTSRDLSAVAFDAVPGRPGANLSGLLQALCDVESVSGNEKSLADQVEALLRSLPLLDVVRDGDAVVARTRLGRPQRIVLAGHLDTVPLTDPPNLPSRIVGGDGDYDDAGVGDGGNTDGDCVWGRGTVDMKAGVAIMLALAVELGGGVPGLSPRHDVTWVFYDNEEVDAVKNGLRRLVANRPDLLAGDFAIVGEPANGGIEGGCNGSIRVEVRTQGKAAHAARAWVGVNAIHLAAPILDRLAGWESRQIDVDGLVYRESLSAVKISGGIAGNVIPDQCVVTVNYRYAPCATPADAEAHLRALFVGYEVTVIDSAAGARPGLDAPIAQEFVAAVVAAGGGQPRPKYGWTDVARFAELGIPAVNFAPGNPLLAHTDNERVPIAQLAPCRDALRNWLLG
ncbi:MAG: succinyl-diaminopimelate desuccinylase [Cellulomonadaceae bacterium]|jgi:succinyl-diaminopimelate desuccinylase|nr:succinyl-diaminopimelate desuccinylase [Cellulomonadaceae bacterium]